MRSPRYIAGRLGTADEKLAHIDRRRNGPTIEAALGGKRENREIPSTKGGPIMQDKRPLISFVTAFLAAFVFLTATAPTFAASKEKVLYSFNAPDGHEPFGSLII